MGAFDLVAEPELAYRTVAFPLGRLRGDGLFRLDLWAPSENPNPLGIALDWIEIDGPGRVRLPWPLHLKVLLVLLAAFLVPRAVGVSQGPAAAHALALVGALAWGFGRDAIACERILSLGAPTYLLLAVLSYVLARVFREPSLSILLLVALALRFAILLHPAFYCNDLWVHSQFTWQLVRRGLSGFLETYLRHQFQFSLGLQNVDGHWYTMPYPPLFYVLSAPIVSVLGYRPEVAVMLVASFVNSLEVVLVFGLARALTKGRSKLALAAAGLAIITPILLIRLSLAYFPAILGTACDAALLLFLVLRWEELDRPRNLIWLAAGFTVAFLAYIQSVLNFGVLFAVLVPWEIFRGRWSRVVGALGSAVLAGLLAFGLFYVRYVPAFQAMHERRPQLEEPAGKGALAPEPDDKNPFFGPNLDLVRGVRKAAWRLYVFYGPYAVVLPFGLVLALKLASSSQARLIGAWASHYLVMNLGSGGLPSPNLLRYNKEMEFAAPLFCVFLALAGAWVFRRSRVLGLLFALGFLVFAAMELAPYWGGTLERTL